MKVERPIMSYQGSKWRIAPWILEHMPDHLTYVEPFGGGGSILLRKERSAAEVYNDVDGEIVNVFRVARDHGEELARRCALTPFSQKEHREAYEPTEDLIEWARRVIARSYLGYGSGSVKRGKGFNRNSTGGRTAAREWATYPEGLLAICNRLRGVVIEHRDGLDVMRSHDAPTTLHYVDPPYVTSTWKAGRTYVADLSDEQHIALLDLLLSLSGMVMVSGYDNELYNTKLAGWKKVTKLTHTMHAQVRTECLWMNELAVRGAEFTPRVFKKQIRDL
jgi:DNA adenine methylase